MGKNVLKYLFDGEINPSESIEYSDSELKLYREMLSEEKTLLRAKLSEEALETLKNADNIHAEILKLYGYDCFVHGFKLCARFLHEALGETGSLSQNKDR